MTVRESDGAGTTSASIGPVRTTADVPRFWRTYALAYAIGAFWLAAELLALGTQPKYAFTGPYDVLLVLPPVLTALCLLAVDRFGSTRTFALRAAVLALAAGVTSVISTVVLTPVLVLMFREGVGRSLSATGAVSAVSLVIVAAPLVPELVASARSRRWLHTGIVVVGLSTVAVAVAMALSPTGPLASAMRLDQGELLMITSSWWLPVYALAAAFVRKLGMA
jgi:hypothetical protein